MKTKSFLLFSISVFVTSIFLILFHSQQPESIQNIVSQTHQHIKDFQENLRDVEENHLVEEQRYLTVAERWHNTTVPALVTHARGVDHAPAVAFVRAAVRLPYTVLLYDLGLKPDSLAIVLSHCNSSRCTVVRFDLGAFPPHVADETIHAFRPLIIQHALSVVGGVIYCEPTERWTGPAEGLEASWSRVGGAGGGGVAAWPRRAAVTSLTHPRMFGYLGARAEDFYFVPMVSVSRFAAADTPAVRALLRPWVRCALTHECIMPLGAQSQGCRFDKKPQYRYSGCHGQDASALSIVLALRTAFGDRAYAGPESPGAGGWRRLADLPRNSSDAEHLTPHSVP